MIRLAPLALTLALALVGCDAPNPITRAVATVARHYFLGGVIVGVLSMLVLVVLVGGRRDSSDR